MKYVLNKNVRYKGFSYKIGDEIEVNKADLEDFIKAGAIEAVDPTK